MKTFIEHAEPVTLQIVESNAATGRMRVRGPFQRANAKNGNGRVYSDPLWNRVLGANDFKERVRSRKMVGEVEHPADGATNLSRVSHIIVSIERQGDVIFGEAEILNTPCGLIIQELVRAGVPVGISSRGRGTSYTRDGVEYINENDYELETFDFVYRPSTPGAFVQQVNEALKGPYRSESSSMDKLHEIKKIEVIAGDAINEARRADAARLGALLVTLTESGASLSALRSADTETDAARAEGKVREAMAAIDTELMQRLAPNGVGGSSMDRGAFWYQKYQDLKAEREGSVTESTRRFDAAVDLSERLLMAARITRDKNERLNKVLLAQGNRLEAAMRIIEGFIDRHDRSKIVKAVRESIDKDSRLRPWMLELLKSESIEDVRSRITTIQATIKASLPPTNEETTPYLRKPTPVKESAATKTPTKVVSAPSQKPNGRRVLGERHDPVVIDDESLGGKRGDEILAKAERDERNAEDSSKPLNESESRMVSLTRMVASKFDR